MEENKPKFNLPEREEKILGFWEKNKIFEKTLAKNKKGKTFVFYEGPPTANAAPGIHHVEARVFKDIIPRYKTMRGFFVPRKAGWDTHGLPVEIQIEKELGFKTKQDIERYGIDKFNAKAKESVWRHKQEFEDLTRRIAFWLDMEHPYITYETAYIETLWWTIKEFWNKKLLYQDFKSVPWCSRCGTALSSHEVGLGYQKVKDLSVYVRMKIKGRKNEYLLVWTTTPWTLPANVAVAINPKAEYTKYKIDSDFVWSLNTPPYEQDQKVTVAEKISGKTLVGLEYEPLYEVPAKYSLGTKPPYKVFPGDFVSGTEGTGLVHIASAFGEDDLNLMKSQYAGSKNSGLHYPILQTVNPDGSMKKGVIGEGKFVKEADAPVIEDLKKRKLLLKAALYEHDYPFCWRCQTPLLYYAREAWWVKTTAVKQKLLQNNEKINWIPEHFKQGRFGEFLREVRDWAFSRERYWGTPLPVWQCAKCGHTEVIGSVAELTKKSGEKLTDLHRPFIDEVTFACAKCPPGRQAGKGEMRRVSEVVDVWFDSGAMPFAQVHWPFAYQAKSKKIKDKSLPFPADYICEAVDQTRGWFYTLLAVATLLGKGTPYKNVITLGHVLDKYGQKMSKSKGNVVNALEMIKKYGADTLRWYFFTINAPADPKRFDEKDLANKLRGFLMIFWNSFVLFDTYTDKIKNQKVKDKGAPTLDQWVLAKLDLLTAEVTKRLDAYDITGAGRMMEEFIVADFSQWFLRRSRRRLQHPQSVQEKNQVAQVSAQVLLTLTKLSAPFLPFLAEIIYQELRHKMSLKEASVHLTDWPLAIKTKGQKTRILEDMEEVRKVVTEALKLRAQAGIRVRQPLQELKINSQKLLKQAGLMELLKEEINVKKISFGDQIWLDEKITPELKEEGMVREFLRNIQEMRRDLGLKPGQVIRIQISGSENLQKAFSKWDSTIKKETNAKELKIGGKKIFQAEREAEFDGEGLWIGIQKN